MSFRTLCAQFFDSAALYDCIQALAGEHQLRAGLVPHLRALQAAHYFLDIGGGTGLAASSIPSRRYICLDLDLGNLRRFRHKSPHGLAVAANAAACPFASTSMDGVLCAKVTHHLTDADLDTMLREIVRILKPGGTLILADAVCSNRWIPRVLWRLDRGSFPRTSAEIRRAVAARYRDVKWQEFRVSIFHDFVLCTARKGEARDHSPSRGS